MRARIVQRSGVLLGGLLAAAGCREQATKTEYFDCAQRCGSKGKLADAAIQYRNALKLDPDFVQGRVALAKLLWRQGDVDGSVSELRKTTHWDSRNLEGLVLLGRVHLLAGRYGV